jgi:hypothetical protein
VSAEASAVTGGTTSSSAAIALAAWPRSRRTSRRSATIPSGQAEHPDDRRSDPGADLGAPEFRRQADRHAGDADREPGPQPRVGPLLAGRDGESGRHERREAEHDERREGGGDAKREAAVDAAELHDLQQQADDGQTPERCAAPAPTADRERDGDERREGEARREQRQRIRHADGDRPDDVAGAPEEDEDGEQASIGHSSTVLRRGGRNNPTSSRIDAHDAPLRRERRDHRAEQLGSAEPAVQQDQRLTRAVLLVVQGQAVHVCVAHVRHSSGSGSRRPGGPAVTA